MKAAFLLLLLCVAEADDIRYHMDAMFKQMNSSLEERLSSLEERLKSCLGGQDADMASRLSASETRIEELQGQVEEQKKEKAEMAAELTASQKQVELLQTRLNTTEDRVKNLETESEAHGAQLSALETRLNVSENKVQKLSILLLSQDCEQIYNNVATLSGVYAIYPTTAPAKVYCDMDTDGGKWTVIQRRVDGTVNFYRPWAQYKAGFGDIAGEFWLGLDNMHLLTKDKKYQLRVDMEDFEGNTASASYSSFSVGSEADGYRLQVAGFRDGGAGDSLTYHNGMRFSTFDKDQDEYNTNCAREFSGAFWYKDCHYVNINGVYQRGTTSSGVNWYHWKSGSYYSLKAVAMKLRRVP